MVCDTTIATISAVRKQKHPHGACCCRIQLRNVRPRGHTEQIALRLPVSDLAAAKAMAEKRGIGYQTLLKAFIHEAIEREQRRA
jgi:hypothetical protein